MKITVMGASGQIGTKVVELLRAAGHETVAAARNSGVDVLTGEGLADALAGADVLVDVVNSPDFAAISPRRLASAQTGCHLGCWAATRE